MLEALKISGFRKYNELLLNNLGRINCVLGSNNIGKTSILEAVYAWACGQNVIAIIAGPMSRERYPTINNPYWMMEELLTLFNDRYNLPLKMKFDGTNDGERICFEHVVNPSDILTDYDSSYKNFPDSVITSRNTGQLPQKLQSIIPLELIKSDIKALAKWEITLNGKNKISYDITVPVLQTAEINAYMPASFIDMLSHTAIMGNVKIYGLLKREKLIDEFVNEISRVFPEISGFDMIPFPDASQSSISIIKKDGGMLPIYAYGDGVQKWFHILGSIVLYRNALLCIDEIDTSFHPAAQQKFCANLINAANRNNVQIFMTTHNLEFVDNFLTAAEKINDKDSIRIITLEENEGKIFTRVLDNQEAFEARNEFGIDLR